MDTHLVILADEAGIANVFLHIKELLASGPQSMLTLFYYSSDPVFVFKRELDILERHFFVQFFVNYENARLNEIEIIHHESLEAAINANVWPKMSFQIAGEQSLIEKAKSLLCFLGIDDIQVIAQVESL